MNRIHDAKQSGSIALVQQKVAHGVLHRQKIYLGQYARSTFSRHCPSEREVGYFVVSPITCSPDILQTQRTQLCRFYSSIYIYNIKRQVRTV